MPEALPFPGLERLSASGSSFKEVRSEQSNQ